MSTIPLPRKHAGSTVCRFSVKVPGRSDIEFEVSAGRDGYTARAVEHSIFAEAETWTELCIAAAEAARCYFKVVTFPAQTPIAHDSSPSDIDPDRDTRPFGNGILESFRSKLPTPPTEPERELTKSIIAYRLERFEIELRNFTAVVRALAETFPK